MSNKRIWVTTPALNKAQLTSLVGNIDNAVNDGRVHALNDVARVYMDDVTLRVLPDAQQGTNPFLKPIFELSGYIRTVSAHNILPVNDDVETHGFIVLPERVSRTSVLLEPSEADLARLGVLGLYDANFQQRLSHVGLVQGYNGVELYLPMNIYSYVTESGVLSYVEPEEQGSYTIALTGVQGERGLEPYFIPTVNVAPIFEGLDGFEGVSRYKSEPELGFMELYEDLYFDEVFEERDRGLLESIADTMDVLENAVLETAGRFKERVARENITLDSTPEFVEESEHEEVFAEPKHTEVEAEPQEVAVEVTEEVVEPSEAVETATQLLEEIKPEIVAKPETKEDVEVSNEDDERYQKFQSRFEKLRKPEFMEPSETDVKDDLDF